MSKGKRRERQAAELYERAGYDVEKPIGTQYDQNTDYYNLFDLMAFCPQRGIRFVQVKANGARGIEDWRAKAVQFSRSLSDVAVDFVVIYDGHGGPNAKDAQCRLIQPVETDGGMRLTHETRVDERDMDCAMGDGVVEWLGGDTEPNNTG